MGLVLSQPRRSARVGTEKNSAAGFTLNFAHRQAYAILLLLLIAPIMIVLLIELLK